MGKKPLRECRKLGCHALTREQFCAKHKQNVKKHSVISAEKEARRQKQYDRYKRDSSAAMFYKSAAWKKARALSIALHDGLCQDCLENGKRVRADMVHHIKPLRQFPELALDQSNLRPLCNKCHGKY